MQNLLYFLFRYGYVFLFICLEIVCFNLIVRYNSQQKETFLKSSNAVTGWIYQHYNSVRQYFSLGDIAHQLAWENARLRNQQGAFQALTLEGNTTLDSNSFQQYELLPARIINNRITGLDNYFTILGGREAGMEIGQGVIIENGIVGILTDVSTHYARGISILNRDSRISASIERNNFFGNLYWEGGNPRLAKLEDVPKHADVQVGDKLITSGFSAIFPKGLKVGTIVDFSLNDGSNFYDINVQLSVDIANAHYVYVVKNLFAREQLILETDRRP
ncbi:MAG: rod shape-determining protein MreC [Saprospiraceae bacterium]|nr:rod shape-determining protein MreC [Saprospiraceae bacterium]